MLRLHLCKLIICCGFRERSCLGCQNPCLAGFMALLHAGFLSPHTQNTHTLSTHECHSYYRCRQPTTFSTFYVRCPILTCCILLYFLICREAEQLLQEKQQGCFLLRLSESKVGFVLSYRYVPIWKHALYRYTLEYPQLCTFKCNSRGEDKCRHFIVEEEDDASGNESRYVIAGENSKHCSLEELINYYIDNPVGPFNERLTVPCLQVWSAC